MSEEFNILKSLKVGDKVFVVQNEHRHYSPYYDTVVSVGRKFVTLSKGSRFESWNFNGYAIGMTQDFPQSTLYKSEDDFNEMVEWDSFRRGLDGFSCNKYNRETRLKLVEIHKDFMESCNV